jgi:hypothetical protein
MANSIIGAGIIGLPFAFKEAVSLGFDLIIEKKVDEYRNN